MVSELHRDLFTFPESGLVFFFLFKSVWVDIRVFDSIPLICLSVFVPISSCFQDYSSITEL